MLQVMRLGRPLRHRRWWPRALAASALAMVAAASPAALQAATWWASPTGTASGSGTSPSDPTTIQYAILRATAGDEVILLAGTYTVASQITVDRELTLHGVTPGAAVLDCSPNTQCMLFSSTSGASELYDVTFLNSAGISIVINDSSPGLHHLRITGSANVGIDVNGTTAAPSIQDSVLINNNYGIISYDTQLAVIAACELRDHAGRGVVVQTNVATEIRDNLFRDNYVGLEIGQGPNQASVHDNRFEVNDWGVYIHTYGDPNANQIQRNQFFQSGVIGVLVSGTGDASLVEANDFLDDAIAVYISGGDDQTRVTNNLIRDSGSHGVVSDGSVPIVAYNTIYSVGLDGIASINSDAAYVVNNISVANGRGGVRVDASSTATQLGYNDAYANLAFNFGGPFINLGGNLSVAPRFIGGGDFHLRCGTTPLLDYAALFAVPRDHDGVARDPLGGSPGAEIGAYEC